MQHDDVIWNSLSEHFCSFKVKTRTNTFCKNEHNVTGQCSRQACPLANSRYATILEKEGRCVLYIKTIERAHMPKTMWETIKLPRNYTKSLEIIDEQLKYWPKFLVHKAKQRLTKITQYLIRMRKLRLRTKTRLVGINKKVEKRDQSRERKALSAAKLDRSIEKELLERLRSGTYDSIYNFPQMQYEKVLEDDGAEADVSDEEEEEEEEEDEMEYEAEYEDGEEEDEEAEDTGGMEPGDIEDLGANGDGDEFDFDDDSELDEGQIGAGDEKKQLARRMKARRRSGKKNGGVQVEVEYEPSFAELVENKGR